MVDRTRSSFSHGQIFVFSFSYNHFLIFSFSTLEKQILYNAHSCGMELILITHCFKGFKMVFIFMNVPFDGAIDLLYN